MKGATDSRARVREWVIRRLKEETRVRGVATKIAKKAEISTAHISNLTGDKPSRSIGDDVLTKLADYWGYKSYAELEAAALGEQQAPSTKAPDGRRAAVVFLSATGSYDTEEIEAAAKTVSDGSSASDAHNAEWWRRRIVETLQRAEAIVEFDGSGNNSNVAFELGLAQGLTTRERVKVSLVDKPSPKKRAK